MKAECREVIVLTTLPKGKGKGFGKALVEARLAACVSVLSTSSVYHWKGEIVEDEEDQLIIKTAKEKINSIEEFFSKNHPYEVPEFIILPVELKGEYKRWLHGVIRC